MKNKKLLVVEDDALMRDMISEILASAGYQIESRENGKDAAEYLRDHSDFDLVVSDINMPVMNGIEMIKAVRAFNTEVPIVMLTGNTEVSVAMKAINLGASDYLIKDENIQDTIFMSVERVLEKQRLVRENQQLLHDLIQKNKELDLARKVSEEEREKADKLLLNILPAKVASEMKEKGRVEPLFFDSATIMFTDLKGFSSHAWNMHPGLLVKELDLIFEEFDHICSRHGVEKIKTIGDAYMCAGGIPEANHTHPVDVCLAALEIMLAMTTVIRGKSEMKEPWELRLGIHTGPITAGVVGKTKTAYDLWGDSVNVASRIESNGVPGRISISCDTYPKVKDLFDCELRGEVEMKNRGSMKVYFLNGILPGLSKDSKGQEPNEKFYSEYAKIKGGRQ